MFHWRGYFSRGELCFWETSNGGKCVFVKLFPSVVVRDVRKSIEFLARRIIKIILVEITTHGVRWKVSCENVTIVPVTKSSCSPFVSVQTVRPARVTILCWIEKRRFVEIQSAIRWNEWSFWIRSARDASERSFIFRSFLSNALTILVQC